MNFPCHFIQGPKIFAWSWWPHRGSKHMSQPFDSEDPMQFPFSTVYVTGIFSHIFIYNEKKIIMEDYKNILYLYIGWEKIPVMYTVENGVLHGVLRIERLWHMFWPSMRSSQPRKNFGPLNEMAREIEILILTRC